MDSSAISAMAKLEDQSNSNTANSKDIVKSSTHSPARANDQSLKILNDPKAKFFRGKELSSKGQNKSSAILAKNGNAKNSLTAQTSKTTSSTTVTSPMDSTSSKIPALKKSNSLNSKTFDEQKRPELKVASRKTAQRQVHPIKKGADLKQINTVLKSIVPDPKQDRTIKSNKAKSNNDSLARQNTKSSVPFTNARNGSNFAICSTKNETNFRKMISTAGDYKNDHDENPQNHDENKILLTKETQTGFECVQSVEKLNNKLKSILYQFFESKSKEANKSHLCEDLQGLNAEISYPIDDFCANIRESCIDGLQETQKSFINMEKKYNDLVAQQEEERVQFEKDLAEKAEADVLKKDEFIKELQKEYQIQENYVNILKTTVQNLEDEKEYIKIENNSFQKDLENSKDRYSTINKKLLDIEEQLRHEKHDAQNKSEMIQMLENDLQNKNMLEADLIEATKNLEELQSKPREREHKLEADLIESTKNLEELQAKLRERDNECVENLKDITELNNQISCLETDKEDLLQQNGKLIQEVNLLENVREKLVESENKLQALQIEYNKQEKFIEISPEKSEEVQMEFAKFHQSVAEKSREICKLKIELSKTQSSICQLEQQVQRDQQLLEVRSDLINSLQTNEKAHRIHIEELFVQVGEKNTTINELNSELQTKSEEFHNLFTKLSTKQIEVANQEHIIKLLEESNERSQMLRVKHEEKIGRLEEELAYLKQTITIYQANVLAGNNKRQLVCSLPALPQPNVDYSENFYYYATQRKRKRQIDINVKKYEA